MIDLKATIQTLTAKQRDVLSCLVFGFSYKVIGRTLNISNRTVESHIAAILRKFNSDNKDNIIRLIRNPENKNISDAMECRFKEILGYENSKKKSYTIFVIVSVILLVVAIFFIVRNGQKEIFEHSNIGFNLYLINRENVLSQIKANQTHDEIDVKVISGQGGAGKTTIAREYLKRCGYQVVYEINAETIETLGDSLSVLAYSLAKTEEQKRDVNFINGIPGIKEKLQQFSIFIYSYLKVVHSWCLLFDNVDDFKMFRNICFNTLPAKGSIKNGQILITTRNNKIEDGFLNFKLIKVGELTRNEKTQLFCKITGEQSTHELCKYLDEIPSYPLDISCCAYYVKNTNTNLKEYVVKMKCFEKTFWRNNKTIIEENTNYGTTRNEIISSALEQIMQINEKFKEILFIISMLDSQNIPLEILSNIHDASTLDELIFHLTKYGFVTFSGNYISIHRSAQAFMLNYFLKNTNNKEQNKLLHLINEKLTPYEHISEKYLCVGKMITHLESLEKNLKNFEQATSTRIFVLITLGFLLKNKGMSTIESLPHFIGSLEMDKKEKVLSVYEKMKVLLAAGEACIQSNNNLQARSYLDKSLETGTPFKRYFVAHAKNYNLLGIVEMRSNNFDKANADFDKALSILNNAQTYSVDVRLEKATSYLNKGVACLLYNVNKPQMKDAICMMESAIEILKHDTNNVDAIKIIANAKLKIAGIYNVLKQYKRALLLIDEAGELLKRIKSNDNNYFVVFGIILMERGHALLRLNDLNAAKTVLKSAHDLCDKTMIGDYVCRLKMQEAETLIRLGYYDDAYKNCMDVLERKDKEKNDCNELFYNTAFYNAAVIQYKLKNYDKALTHFKYFTNNMSIFCKKFLSQQKYDLLLSKGVFQEITCNDLRKYFKDALEIYKAICMDGSEFITDYVQKNYENSVCTSH